MWRLWYSEILQSGISSPLIFFISPFNVDKLCVAPLSLFKWAATTKPYGQKGNLSSCHLLRIQEILVSFLKLIGCCRHVRLNPGKHAINTNAKSTNNFIPMYSPIQFGWYCKYCFYRKTMPCHHRNLAHSSASNITSITGNQQPPQPPKKHGKISSSWLERQKNTPNPLSHLI